MRKWQEPLSTGRLTNKKWVYYARHFFGRNFKDGTSSLRLNYIGHNNLFPAYLLPKLVKLVELCVIMCKEN